MRTLKFIIDGQIITADPNCDFSNLVRGTEGYLQAEFSFSPEWNGTVRVASFNSGYRESEPQILMDGKTCMIPADVLKHKTFEIKVLGKKNNLKLTTNTVVVCQDGGV